MAKTKAAKGEAKMKLLNVDVIRPMVTVQWYSDEAISSKIHAMAEEAGADNVGGGTYIGGKQPERDEQFEFDSWEAAKTFEANLRETFDVDGD